MSEKRLADLGDEELIELIRGGKREAYRVLVERYQQRVYAIAFEIVKRKEDAEDIAQESFVKAYLSLKSFKGESSFFTWLYRITYNMSLDFRRSISRKGGAPVEFDEGSVVQESSSHGELAARGSGFQGPYEAIANRERVKVLRQALDQISDEHRAVVILREVEGMSYDEIAKVVGISKGTVMSRLHYARKSLQKALKDFAPQVHGN